MTTREKFLATYNAFRTDYSSALSKADFEYQNITSSLKQYQEIVNSEGDVVDKVLDPSKFVIIDTDLPSLDIQKKTIYFYKEDPVTMTIPSGIEGYPDFGPFPIDPIDHTGPKKDQIIDRNLLSQIYGNIFSGYTSPILFRFLEVNDKFSPGEDLNPPRI